MAIKKDVAITVSSDPYIDRLEGEKLALETRIKELQDEIRAINNLIYRRRSELFAGTTGQKHNLKTADRLFFETLILDTLNYTKNGLRTGELHDKISRQGYGLNYNTLRSYVMRMRDKGLIRKKTPNSYYWIASPGTTITDTRS